MADMASRAESRSATFVRATEVPVEQLEPGIKRQILGYGPDLMAVRVWFAKGAVGQQHAHHHSQTSYVERGRFLVTIDGEESELGPGDGFFVAPHAMHGALCLENGILLDMFSPVRADFLDPADLGR